MSYSPGRTLDNSNGNFRLFLGCFIALVATAFGFVVRQSLMPEWRADFKLTNEQAGYIGGAGLYPMAISIILFSLIVDRIGYGTSMIFAFLAHTISAIMTLFAQDFATLYWATFIFALGNGVVEAVINPVVATMYPKNKTHWLNILHAGWPGGLVFGGLFGIAVARFAPDILPEGSDVWRWQMGLLLIPTVLYGILLFGQRFPAQERVAAGVTYLDMLREFGWGSAYVVSFLLLAGFNQILLVTGIQAMSLTTLASLAVVPTLLFAIFITDTKRPPTGLNPIADSFGRPMFIFLLFVMFLLATTELGTDGWMPDIVGSILKDADGKANVEQGTLFLVYTSFIMFVLRFFAGPIVHRISPLGLLMVSAMLAAAGLLWLANAGNAAWVLFMAATVYAFGKTFFWPTTLGVVSERYPKGGALMLNAIAGVGMLAVGTIGGPMIGTWQDMAFDRQMAEENPALHARVVTANVGIFGPYNALDQSKKATLNAADLEKVTTMEAQSKQSTLATIAIMPVMMFVCYLILVIYFRSQGGYQAEVLLGHAAEDEKFTGGVRGPVE